MSVKRAVYRRSNRIVGKAMNELGPKPRTITVPVPERPKKPQLKLVGLDDGPIVNKDIANVVFPLGWEGRTLETEDKEPATKLVVLNRETRRQLMRPKGFRKRSLSSAHRQVTKDGFIQRELRKRQEKYEATLRQAEAERADLMNFAQAAAT